MPSTMISKRHVWALIDRNATLRDCFLSRQAAINWAAKMRLPGVLVVVHKFTGERWERRQGSWFKVQMAKAS